MIKRCNLFIAVLSIAATLAFTLFAAAVTLNPTFAAEASDFYMEHGAYVYINPEETDAENNALSGVKFRAYVPNTEDTYGMLIVPVDYFAKANIVRGTSINYVQAFADAYEEEKIAYPATVYTGLEVKTANGKNYVEYSIADIKANNYDRNWFGIAFKVTGEEGSEVYTYAKEDDNVRSIQYVISCCLGELEFNADNLSEEDKSVYNSYKDVFGSIVSTSISNVVKENETVTYEINALSEEYVKVGEKAQLSVNLTQGVNLKTFWSVDDTSIATIDGNGAITAIASGSVTVTAKAVSGNGTYISDSITVKVKSEADIKFESMTGDELDKKIVAYASDYQPLVYSAAIDNTEKYGEDSTSSMKFTFTQPSSTVYELANTLRGTMFLDDSNILYDACKNDVTDWATAYIGFYIKSSVACNDVIFKFATRSGTDWLGPYNFYFDAYSVGKLPSTNNEWKYVEMSLDDARKNGQNNAYNYHTTNVNGFKFSLSTEVNVGTGNTATFWIDGLKLFNKPIADTFDEQAIKTTVGNFAGNYQADINYDKAYVKDGLSSLQYDFKKGTNRGRFMYYDSDFSSDIFGINANTFANEVYVGFWLKQKTKFTSGHINIKVCMQNTCDGTTWKGVDYHDFDYHGNKDLPDTTDWQYVEFKISDVLGSNSSYSQLYTSNVTRYRFSITTEIAEDMTFYIDGLSIYNK